MADFPGVSYLTVAASAPLPAPLCYMMLAGIVCGLGLVALTLASQRRRRPVAVRPPAESA